MCTTIPRCRIILVSGKGRFTFPDDRSLALRNTTAQFKHILKKIIKV